MADKEHRHEGTGDEERRIREEHLHFPRIIHQKAARHGRGDLRRHGSGIVVTRIFSDVAARRKFHDHRKGVDVDGGPAHAGQREEDQHDQAVSFEEEGGAEGPDHTENADENGLFAADAGGQKAHRNKHDDGGALGHHQRHREVSVRDIPDVLGVQRKRRGHGIVGHKPQKDRG